MWLWIQVRILSRFAILRSRASRRADIQDSLIRTAELREKFKKMADAVSSRPDQDTPLSKDFPEGILETTEMLERMENNERGILSRIETEPEYSLSTRIFLLIKYDPFLVAAMVFSSIGSIIVLIVFGPDFWAMVKSLTASAWAAEETKALPTQKPLTLQYLAFLFAMFGICAINGLCIIIIIKERPKDSTKWAQDLLKMFAGVFVGLLLRLAE